jgi:hypothetical protein
MNTFLAIIIVVVVLFLLFKVFKLILRLIVVIVFLLLAYFTNPNLEKHIHAVDEKAEAAHQSVSLRHVHRKDYKIFSLTEWQNGDDSKIIGAGMFTKVWIYTLP